MSFFKSGSTGLRSTRMLRMCRYASRPLPGAAPCSPPHFTSQLSTVAGATEPSRCLILGGTDPATHLAACLRVNPACCRNSMIAASLPLMPSIAGASGLRRAHSITGQAALIRCHGPEKKPPRPSRQAAQHPDSPQRECRRARSGPCVASRTRSSSRSSDVMPRACEIFLPPAESRPDREGAKQSRFRSASWHGTRVAASKRSGPKSSWQVSGGSVVSSSPASPHLMQLTPARRWPRNASGPPHSSVMRSVNCSGVRTGVRTGSDTAFNAQPVELIDRVIRSSCQTRVARKEPNENRA
jgi:hypothetical protein